jgi:hypothetical protein
MYTLYFSRLEQTIKVTKALKAFQNLNFTDEVTKYNSCYYICSNRNLLIEEAKEIKQIWISELEQELRLIKEIKL